MPLLLLQYTFSEPCFKHFFQEISYHSLQMLVVKDFLITVTHHTGLVVTAHVTFNIAQDESLLCLWSGIKPYTAPYLRTFSVVCD